MKSEQIDKLATALAKAQAEIKGAVKDSANPFFKSNYADLQSVWDAIREPLTKNGLAVIQTTEAATPDHLELVTTLVHSSGQWVEGRFPILALKRDPQAIGSATSYARRYALAAIVGVYQTDDDAESTQDRSYEPKTESKPKAKPTPAPVSAPAKEQPKQDPQPPKDDAAVIAASRKPYYDKIAKTDWTKDQLSTYAKMVFGKTDASSLTLSELMKFTQTVTSESFDKVFNFDKSDNS